MFGTPSSVASRGSLLRPDRRGASRGRDSCAAATMASQPIRALALLPACSTSHPGALSLSDSSHRCKCSQRRLSPEACPGLVVMTAQRRPDWCRPMPWAALPRLKPGEAPRTNPAGWHVVFTGLGSQITGLADRVGVRVYFNPFVEWRDKEMKYGVVRMKTWPWMS
ncbi:phosphatidate cytidylyltransferase, mitochondrial isoform X2 [Panicum miliaceum]|uniref:Phosphatidate cytidylyltransferase, mitochondrial isoform X2 n=1 Tax=Panicum miliaceum TaxID=4540 RepID=A0A3L6T691_PANMI|nr:phosphatidate cytidylyltransferase, mitochondrial isoform X2 [Panicum miliaceum]